MVDMDPCLDYGHHNVTVMDTTVIISNILGMKIKHMARYNHKIGTGMANTKKPCMKKKRKKSLFVCVFGLIGIFRDRTSSSSRQ